jgi:hypothetical protein
MDENEKIRLRVCSALLTNHRAELEKALDIPEDILGLELHNAVRDNIKNAPIPGDHVLVKLTMYLPAWVQYMGQRAVLLFPRLAFKLLRSSGLHQQMY